MGWSVAESSWSISISSHIVIREKNLYLKAIFNFEDYSINTYNFDNLINLYKFNIYFNVLYYTFIRKI